MWPADPKPFWEGSARRSGSCRISLQKEPVKHDSTFGSLRLLKGFPLQHGLAKYDLWAIWLAACFCSFPGMQPHSLVRVLTGLAASRSNGRAHRPSVLACWPFTELAGLLWNR